MKGEAVTIEERLRARRARLLELEAAHVSELSAARYDLEAALEELRELRAEKARRERRFYTEAEVAEQLHVSVKTVAKLRKRLRLEVTQPCATVILYTEGQRDALVEALTKNRKQAAKPSGGTVSEIGARRRA